ncbi:MAG: nucleotidyltransferase family protein [Alphaproteobacteria bacterium]|nr:nucleotidyltransferase family protein [Alphaproteobacteria bacterium]
MMPSTAMILAAGEGTRMRPLTEHMPKPLVPVAGKPLIDYVLDRVVAAGVKRAVVNTRYKAEMLEAHLAGRKDVEILISRETENLETGGGIVNALDKIGNEPFFSLNADSFWLEAESKATLLERLAAAYDSSLDAMLALCPLDQATGYDGKGDFLTNGEGKLRLRGREEHASSVFMGVQILHPRLFAGRSVSSFSLRVFYEKNDPEGWIPNMKAIFHEGRWLHVGDPQGLRLAENILMGAQHYPI